MKKIIFWILTIGLLAFIFGNSLLPASGSTAVSDRFLWFGLSSHFVRKTAHFLEFALLGGLFAIDFSWKRARVPLAGVALAVLLAACADETLQLFADGRASMLADVWLDFCGGLVGLGVLAFCKKRFSFFD